MKSLESGKNRKKYKRNEEYGRYGSKAKDTTMFDRLANSDTSTAPCDGSARPLIFDIGGALRRSGGGTLSSEWARHLDPWEELSTSDLLLVSTGIHR